MMLACGGGDDTGNVLLDADTTAIHITDDGCTPTKIAVRTGETRRLDVRNETEREYELRSDRPNAPDRGLVVAPGTTMTTFIGDAQAQLLICSDTSGNTTMIDVSVTE